MGFLKACCRREHAKGFFERRQDPFRILPPFCAVAVAVAIAVAVAVAIAIAIAVAIAIAIA